jgi:hypothetical protein
MAKRLLSALASIGHGEDEVKRVFFPDYPVTDPEVTRRPVRGMTVRQFRALAEVQQLFFLNGLWKAIAEPVDFNTLASEMVDPSPRGHAFESAMAPGLAGRRAGSPAHAFRTLGVGFRVDGSSQRDVDRILQNGMTQQRANLEFMHSRRGLYLEGTVLGGAGAQQRGRVWTGNKDSFNECAICVSRNFFGATAFPERESRGAYNLWAVDCSGLKGADVEATQGEWVWRPGEKAFREIPPERILGRVTVTRLGGGKADGWRFFLSHASWITTGRGTRPQREYMDAELAAWRAGRDGHGGIHFIPPENDFNMRGL